MIMKISKISITLFFVALCSDALCAQAQAFLVPTNPAPQVSLSWNLPTLTGSNITNVYLYQGSASGQYTNKIPLGVATNTTFVLNARGVAFFFAVTLKDSNGLESVFSNEVNYTAPNPPPPPTMKPLVVLVVQSAPSATGAFAQTGMNWSVASDQPEQAFRLQIQRGIVTAQATPPMPK